MLKSVCFLLGCMSLLFVITGSLSISVHAQTQAVCTFKMFNPPSGYPGGLWPNGINHYNTVVGGVYTLNENSEKAFIRYSSGGMTLFSPPNALFTALNKRNLYGTSVGLYTPLGAVGFPGAGSHGLILTPHAYATLDFPGSNSTTLSGINKWNVIVGSALNPTTGRSYGFKHVNGTFTKIKYPNAVQTTTTAINDNGVIVGGYELGSSENPWYGYILKNGTFKKLSYIPADINNSGIIVAGYFIFYPNGTVKRVTVAGASSTFVNGINDLGTITGGAIYTDSNGNSTFKGFTAVCH
jgi:hypothetical protein